MCASSVAPTLTAEPACTTDDAALRRAGDRRCSVRPTRDVAGIGDRLEITIVGEAATVLRRGRPRRPRGVACDGSRARLPRHHRSAAHRSPPRSMAGASRRHRSTTATDCGSPRRPTTSVRLASEEQLMIVMLSSLAVLLLGLAGMTIRAERHSLVERASLDTLTRLPNRSEFERTRRDRARGGAALRGGRLPPPVRPRRVQGDQRHARPPSRRRGAARDGQAPAPRRSRIRRRGPLGRRRVRADAARHRGRVSGPSPCGEPRRVDLARGHRRAAGGRERRHRTVPASCRDACRRSSRPPTGRCTRPSATVSATVSPGSSRRRSIRSSSPPLTVGRRRTYAEGVTAAESCLTSKLEGFGTTIFAEMSALAVQTGAINLGQGFPDTDGPAVVLEAAIEAIRSGVNQYPPGPGNPVLRSAIADHQRRFYGLEHDPDTEVLVTAGATEALAGALLGMLDTGDEVVVFEPMYDSYQACIALAGAIARPVLLAPSDARLRVRPRRAARGDLEADQADPAEHAAQPDRQGVHARRADVHRRPGDRARSARRDRRGVRAPRVLGFDARPDGDAARDGRADADHLVGRQDVQHDRLEGRLGVRPGTDGRRDTNREAVPHLRQRRPVPAGDRRRPGAARRVLRRRRRRPRGQARPLVRRSRRGRVHRLPAGGDVLHDRRHPPAARRRRRDGVLPLAASPVRRGGGPEPGVLRPNRARPAPRAVRVLQAARRDRRRGQPACRSSRRSRA